MGTSFTKLLKYGCFQMMLASLGATTAMAKGGQSSRAASVSDWGAFLLIGVILVLLTGSLHRRHTREISTPAFDAQEPLLPQDQRVP